MYSIVLATMLTTSAAAPDWGRGCCGGCCGGCWGCCGGCYGCWGCCGGCWGCCGGCWGCWGGCYGCCGGCYGCCGGCWGCWGGCWGCYGGYGYGGWGYAAPVVVASTLPTATTVPATQQLPAASQKEKQSMLLGNAAAVIVKAPSNIQLSVEDRMLPRGTGEQTFRTPDLTPGYVYTYTFKANGVRDGQPVSYTKQIKVSAGQTLTADFTKLIAEGKDTARVTVKLPSDARLYVDGVVCPLTSASRSFDTPELDVGRKYYYTLKAEVVRDGVMRTARKRAVVEAGKEVTVEFSDLPSVQTVSR